ncbi:FAD-dependent oxidoreductase [Streptomyces sp. NPDC048352]|uniref:FAD-dependent oxidoreductase n=1 Tax=Streptomyces sp. NPDC048352 TaxID=3154718 RepID=UPI0034458417
MPGPQSAPFRAPARADLSVTGRAAPSVLVLGSGVAGLTVAYELGKAGYDCVVLEAKDRPGGRNWTVRAGTVERESSGFVQRAHFSPGQFFKAGAARFAQWMLPMDYCRELAVPVEMCAGYRAHAAQAADGADGGRKPVRRGAANADTLGYVHELLAKVSNQDRLDAHLTDTSATSCWNTSAGSAPPATTI